MSGLTLGSLFDGIGVFPLAASRCGIRPLWASEIEAAPISITRRHFPDMAHLGDITKLDGGAIPPVHVLTFGSPCQNLSQIGRREGLDGAKSGLFFHAIRIIQEMRKATNDLYPVITIWENVPYVLKCINDIFPNSDNWKQSIGRLPHFSNDADGMKEQAGFFPRKARAVADL